MNHKSNTRKRSYVEVILYVSLWLIMLSLPLWINGESFSWKFTIREWKRYLPFFTIFIINNFFLAPKLLLKSKYTLYIVFSVTMVTGIVVLDAFIKQKSNKYNNTEIVKKMPEDTVQAQIKSADIQTHTPQNKAEKKIYFSRSVFCKIGLFIVGILLIGFNSGLKIFIQWTNDKEKYSEIEKLYLDSELAFLKQQISPHFFMNTLNNIHILIDLNAEKAKDSIIKLSKLMRYLLYNEGEGNISLTEEISFLENYIELMRLRYDEKKLTVKTTYVGNLSSIRIPAFLFLPLIENAFKHGINPTGNSFINIFIEEKKRHLTIIVTNSNFSKKSESICESSGIGLENISKRLDILYPNLYDLIIMDEDKEFQVSLTIPIR